MGSGRGEGTGAAASVRRGDGGGTAARVGCRGEFTGGRINVPAMLVRINRLLRKLGAGQVRTLLDIFTVAASFESRVLRPT
jgi:hypothetical protein